MAIAFVTMGTGNVHVWHVVQLSHQLRSKSEDCNHPSSVIEKIMPVAKVRSCPALYGS